MFIYIYWLHAIEIMLHVLHLSVSVYGEFYKKPKLQFYAFQSLNFVPYNGDEAIFCFLEKLQDVFVAFRHCHFPYAKSLVEFISLYFKIKPSCGSDWLWQHMIVLVQNLTIKIFKNVSRKICSGHRFL